jgi:hypothetical protein
MILSGPSYYSCPECSAIHERTELMSGNTFNAKYYSDGKMEAPMLPEIPSLIRCEQCALIFKLDRDLRLSSLPSETEKTFFANCLDVKGWTEALEMKLYENDIQELNCRYHLLWAYNDPFRKESNVPCALASDTAYKKNILRMLDLIDKEDDQDMVFAAEMNRLIGRFDDSQKILDQLKHKASVQELSVYITSCEERNEKGDSNVYCI